MGRLRWWPGQRCQGIRMMAPTSLLPPQRVLFLEGGHGTVAVVRSVLDMPTSLFHW